MFADAEPAASKDTAIITIMARAIIITIMPMITVTPTGMPAAADTITATIMTTHTDMTTATIMGTTITIMATITTGITATSTMAPAPQASPFRA